jgi:hypothetical protein
MLHLRVLNEMESGVQGGTTSIGDADMDDLLVRQCDTDIPIPRQLEDSVIQSPRMFIKVGPTKGFVELGLLAASSSSKNRSALWKHFQSSKNPPLEALPIRQSRHPDPVPHMITANGQHRPAGLDKPGATNLLAGLNGAVEAMAGRIKARTRSNDQSCRPATYTAARTDPTQKSTATKLQ